MCVKYSRCSNVAATFADEISTTSVKIQIVVRSGNNVSLINLLFIVFLVAFHLAAQLLKYLTSASAVSDFQVH